MNKDPSLHLHHPSLIIQIYYETATESVVLYFSHKKTFEKIQRFH